MKRQFLFTIYVVLALVFGFTNVSPALARGYALPPTVTVEGLPPVGFHLSRYDTSRALVIDPMLVYSTYLGGGGQDESRAIAVDGSGNVYVTGVAYSSNFPLVNPVQSNGGAFVTKLNAAGAFVYSTYLGGDGGPRGIAVDGSGNVYVTGITFSPNFPTVNAAQPTFGGRYDVFVTKLDATGGYVYSTYLGGTGEDEPRGIAVDGSGNAYVTGLTTSPNFPTVNAAQPTFGGGFYDVFVTKLDVTGGFAYSTYLGGSSYDYSNAIAVDGSGNAYVAGHSYSSNFPTVNAVQSVFGSGFFDGFVTKLDATGGYVYSTYLGGSDYDYSLAITADGSGNAYVTGYTFSPNFPTVNAAQPTFGGNADSFVTKLDATGGFAYSTYLGGSSHDGSMKIAVDGSGNTYVTGSTTSSNFPTVNAAQPTFGGNADSFVTKLDATGGFAYSTYLGGSSHDGAIDFAADGNGNTYVTGSTTSPNFPTVNAVQSTFGNINDVFVTKLDATGGYVYSTYLGGSGEDQSRGLATDGSGNAYVAGYTSSLNFPIANAVQSTFGGLYDAFVTKIAENQLPTTDAGGPYSVNEGGSVQITATGNDPENGSLTYAWDLDNNGSFETPGQTVTFSAVGLEAPDTKTIQVQVTDEGGLTATDQAEVTIIHHFSDFFAPVDPLPTFNAAKAGVSVPVKFSLSGDQGLNIFAAGYPKSEAIPCDSTAELDGIEETVAAGNSNLSYDPTTDMYTYVWKTDKLWANTCRQLVLKLDDGTFYRANFKFTK